MKVTRIQLDVPNGSERLVVVKRAVQLALTHDCTVTWTFSEQPYYVDPTIILRSVDRDVREKTR